MKTTRRARRDAKQLFRLCLTDGLLNEDRVRQMAQRVSESHSRSRLGLLWHLRRLVKLELARRTALIQSAMPLPAEFQADVETRLAGAYGPGLRTLFEHSPALIGGMRIQVGSDVYDASVRARLAALEANF